MPVPPPVGGGVVVKVLAAVVALLVLGASPADAHADVQPKWAVDTICVQSSVDKDWHVKAALRAWNELEGPTFVLEEICSEWEGSVVVTYAPDDTEYTGYTNWYYDAEGNLVHADVTVNPRRVRDFSSSYRQCLRNHTMSHEFGHVLGLRHYPHSHAGSVMSYQKWWINCGRLDNFDRRSYAKLY